MTREEKSKVIEEQHQQKELLESEKNEKNQFVTKLKDREKEIEKEKVSLINNFKIHDQSMLFILPTSILKIDVVSPEIIPSTQNNIKYIMMYKINQLF